jgi:hypothetical protein
MGIMANTLLRPNAGDNLRKFCTPQVIVLMTQKAGAILRFWMTEEADFVSYGAKWAKPPANPDCIRGLGDQKTRSKP